MAENKAKFLLHGAHILTSEEDNKQEKKQHLLHQVRISALPKKEKSRGMF